MELKSPGTAIKTKSKFLYLNLLLTVFFLSFLLTGCNIADNFSMSNDSSVEIVPNNNSFLELDFSINNYTITKIEENGKIYSDVTFDDGVRLDKKGFAALPFLHASVQLPGSGEVEYEIIDEEHIDIPLLHPFLPSRGIIYRNQNPANIKRSIDPASFAHKNYPNKIIKLSEPYIFRDVRGINVYVHSFTYDANNQILRIYTKLRVAINHYNTIESRNSMKSLPKTIVNEMRPIYKSLFINYTPLNKNSEIQRSLTNGISEFGELLVLYTSRDQSAIIPYLDWKRQMGYTVHAKQIPTGINVKTIIQNEYNINKNLLYVQLVGDWDDIKSDLGTSENKPMDPMLGCVSGSDLYPDLIIGRFSGETSDHITTQVNKAINYEKNPDTSGSWYTRSLGLGSSEGPGDDSEIDFEHINNIANYKLENYTFKNSYLYTDGDSPNMTSSAINDGVSVINYCGHGSINGWGTTDYYKAHLNNLSNGNKLPIIISVACQVGAFNHTSESFAEVWLRKSNGGAVAALMATILQSWSPPMRGQDYMNDILVGGYDYSTNPGSGISTNDLRTTFGSITFNGLVLMYSEKNNIDDEETLQTWTIFGDASLQVRTDKPKPISISNYKVKAGEALTAKITSNGSGVQGARVTVSQGTTVFTALTNESGNVTINHSLVSGQANVVVTGYNLDTLYYAVTINGDTPPPPPIDETVVKITSPENGTIFQPTEGFIVRTDVQSDVEINAVILQINNEFHSYDLTEPYEFTVKDLAPGTYSLKIMANDAGEKNTYSETILITVQDNPPPPPIDETILKITSPGNGDVFQLTEEFIVKTNIQSNVRINAVILQINNDFHSSDLTAPYEFTVKDLAPGTYSLRIMANDVKESITYSETILITVQDNPVPPPIDETILKITSPGNGNVFHLTEEIIVKTHIQSNVRINAVILQINNEFHSSDLTAPYEFNVKDLPQGTYSLRIMANDVEGKNTYSESRLIIIEDGPPPGEF